MKYVRQACIILFISFIGEILNYIIPLPIPASIYGIIILFFALLSGIIKVSDVKDVGGFLVDIMQIAFIPATVGLIQYWGIIRTAWLKYAVMIAVTTFAVMAVSGRVTELVMRRKGGSSDA